MTEMRRCCIKINTYCTMRCRAVIIKRSISVFLTVSEAENYVKRVVI